MKKNNFMKKILFFLCLFLLFGFKNPNNNDTPIIMHFEEILNEYRHSNGLSKVVIDESIKEFADSRSKSLVTDYSHNGFNENIHSYISDFTYGGENIVKIYIPKKDIVGGWISDVKEIDEILNKMTLRTSTDYDVAKYCFLSWKHSESHNELLLDKKIKRFYLSYQKTESHYYFSFIALDYD
jgi:uncharacterized protein YkwD